MATPLAVFVSALAAVTLSLPGLRAQALVADLRTTPSQTQNGSGITEIAVAGGWAYFSASGQFGRELYVSDGTPTGSRLLIDLGSFRAGNPGASSDPRELLPFGSELLFTAQVEGLGRELWKTDGTLAGSTLVFDHNLAAATGNPRFLTPMGGEVFYAATGSAAAGATLWKTDGTGAGTTSVGVVSNPTEIVASGSTLFFGGSAPLTGTELWKSDGTTAGTTEVLDLPNASLGPTKLTPFQNGVLFGGSEGGLGNEPFFSDGTAAGTVRLADLSPSGSSSPDNFTVLGSVAVFVAYTPALGSEIYVTDGTPAGTSLLADINPGSGGSLIDDLTVFQGYVYFKAHDGGSAQTMWRTDGTAANTAEFVPASTLTLPSDFVQVGSELWFTATSTVVGREPWKTDGTPAGTQLLLDVNTAGSSSPAQMVPFGNGVVCSMSTTSGAEPGFIDGTAANSVMLFDVNKPNASSIPDDFAPFPGGAYFTANSEADGNEGFVTDGTPTGTTLIDVSPGINPSFPGEPALLGNEIFFAASIGTDRELYKSDGSTFTKLTDVGNTQSTSPQDIVAVANHVVFEGFSPGAGGELWSSDGTVAGTQMIMAINPGSGTAGIANMVSNGTVALFTAFEPSTGTELYITDGTAAGTFVVDLFAGSASSTPRHIVAAGNKFYFAAGSALSGQLYVSDGTAAGTSMVNSPGGTPKPIALTPSGSRVFFRGSWSGAGQELIVSDGTGAGTAVVDLVPGLSSSVINSLVGAAGGAFFVWDGSNSAGAEVWFSDGTPAGTTMLRDIAPGFAGGPVPDTLVPTFGGSHVVFQANDLQNGLQLWISDGTPAGTVPATTFGGNGVGAATIGEVFAVGSRVFFNANDGLLGQEPYSLDTGVSFTQTYGTGCAPAAQPVPAISSSGGLPALGNASYSVDLQNGGSSSVAFLLLSFAPTSVHLGGGCDQLLALPTLSLGLVFTDPLGGAARPFPIPNDPAGLGLNAFFQYFAVVPSGQYLGVLNFSDGLQIQLAN